MASESVCIGQYWKSKRGVIYRVNAERFDGVKEVELVPIRVPEGFRARTTWKYSEHVPFDMELVHDRTTG